MTIFKRRKVEAELVPKPAEGQWLFGMFKNCNPFVATIEGDRLDYCGFNDGDAINAIEKWKDIVDEIEYWGYFPFGVNNDLV